MLALRLNLVPLSISLIGKTRWSTPIPFICSRCQTRQRRLLTSSTSDSGSTPGWIIASCYFSNFPTTCFAGLAQLVEQCPRKAKITGSSPVSGIKSWEFKSPPITGWAFFLRSHTPCVRIFVRNLVTSKEKQKCNHHKLIEPKKF